MGVASNRVDVHQACAAAERAIERRAEPLDRAAPPGRPRIPHRAPRHRVAAARAEQRARLVVCVQRRRGRRRGRSSATRRRARSATASRATRSTSLAREIDAPAGVDRGGEPDRESTAAGSSAFRVARRGSGAPAQRSTTARRARPRWCDTLGGVGFATHRRRPEGLAGSLEPDARARVRRHPHRPVRPRAHRRRRRRRPASGAGTDDTGGRPRGPARRSCSPSRVEERERRRPRDQRAAAARSSPRVDGEFPASAGARSRRSTARARRPRLRAERARARERAPPRGGRPARRHVHDHHRRRRASRGISAGSSTVATAATPTTTHRPPRTSSSTGPRR